MDIMDIMDIMAFCLFIERNDWIAKDLFPVRFCLYLLLPGVVVCWGIRELARSASSSEKMP